jgi:hypothetical protein
MDQTWLTLPAFVLLISNLEIEVCGEFGGSVSNPPF